MRIHFYNPPCYFSLDSYQNTIGKVVEFLKLTPGVSSIFQVGTISNPGISDIDLLVVFNDGVRCNIDPIQQLGKKEQYLLPHGVFGISSGMFHESLAFGFFQNFKALYGKEVELVPFANDGENKKKLEQQIAVEFLLLNWIKKTIELTYRIVNVRSMLLSTKSIMIDLQFLGISSGSLFQLVQQIISVRNNWFAQPMTKCEMEEWNYQFHRELKNSLSAILIDHPPLLADHEEVKFSRHILWRRSKNLDVDHRGVFSPWPVHLLGQKYFHLLNRFNRFTFKFPYIRTKFSDIVAERNEFLRKMALNHYNYFPKFAPIGGNILSVFKSAEDAPINKN